MREPAIVARDVSVSFRTPAGRLPVIDRITLDVPSGGWTTLVGPSGCGKTTLLRMLAGLTPPDSGELAVGGVSCDPRDRIAYLPQSDTLLPWRTALDNAVLASEIERRPRAQARQEARALFARFGLAGFEATFPAQLSGGMRQRLALIRTFLAHREILLLDEPLASLDALARMRLQDWLLHAWEEMRKTILLVTHDVEEAVLLSDSIVLLSRRPAHVRRRFPVAMSRPRRRAAPELGRLREEILALIFAEVSDA